MNFDTAKAILVDNAVGANDYDNLTTWTELFQAADFEIQCAKDRVLQLGRIEAAASIQDLT